MSRPSFLKIKKPCNQSQSYYTTLMNDKIMSLSQSTRELRIERNAADSQRFELKLLIARLTQRDKRSASMLLNIMSAHETARSNIRNQVIVDTLIATEMAPDFPVPEQGKSATT